MAKLIAIQDGFRPYIVEDDYDISDSIIWDKIDKCYLRNDNDIKRTEEQYLIARNNKLERL